MIRDSVSVVIPTYNRAGDLPRAIGSALRQTHRPVEIIVVDDGSTDGTAEWCKGNSHGIRYIWQENAGVSAARNRGMREARGEWIALLDSDDTWAPEKLRVQLAALNSTPLLNLRGRMRRSACCITGCSLYAGESEVEPKEDSWRAVFASLESHPLSAAEFFAQHLDELDVLADEMLYTCYTGDAYSLLFCGNIALPSSFVIHRDLIAEIGYFDESLTLAEETEYFHRVAAKSPITVVMAPLVRYSVAKPDSLTAPKNSERLIRNALSSMDRAARLRAPLSQEERSMYEKGRYAMIMRLAYTQLSNLDRHSARATIALLKGRWGTRTRALYAATLLPSPFLRGARSLKSAITEIMRVG